MSDTPLPSAAFPVTPDPLPQVAPPALAARTHSTRIWGLAASFEDSETLIEAARAARDKGYAFETYTPFPVEGLDEAMGHRKSRVSLISLVGALLGGTSGFGMMWFATVVHYPLNVGGKPLTSWPAYIPITFELTVLGAAFGAVFGAMALSRLPQLYHPVFDIAAFRRASHDRFFLVIEAGTAGFDRIACRQFLKGFGPASVAEVPLR